MPVHRLIAVVLIAGSLACAAGDAPVLVELFTSEGCSSCPAADQLLAVLEREQPVPGARIIALSEHVDYWNRLGWTDPYSSAEWSARQQQYAAVFRNEGAYTPQMVVDGRVEFVGSDTKKAAAVIAAAARDPKAVVRIAIEPDNRLRVVVENIPASSAGADVLLAITESYLSSNVLRGENEGRRLGHTGVVRRLSVLGRIQSGGFSTDAKWVLKPEWVRENLRAVVFVQERGTRRILGAAVAGL